MATPHRKPIHQQPKLCDHILSHAAKSGVSLRIGESSIPQAGSGLFAVNDIPAGSEIFHTSPLITVAESAQQGICDFCFLNSCSSVDRNGRFYSNAEDDVRPEITRCGACRVARYCSKVSPIRFSANHLLTMSLCVLRNARPRRGRATTNTNVASCKKTQP
jgi:SET and MYND domain-containing protein